MIGEVLKKLNEDASGKCQQRIIDDADAVAAITLESDVIVSFPTAEVLDDLRDIEKQKYRLKIIANPQWNTSGAIIGDFGFGPWKKRAEDFVGKFSNDMYGDILVTLLKKEGKKSRKKYYLNLDVNNNIKNFDLEWWEGNTFLTDKDEKWLEKLFVDFKEEDGSIKSLKIYNVQFDKVSN